MDKIELLLATGGYSMMAILVISVLLVSVIIAKMLQFTFKAYWFRKTTTNQDILRARFGLRFVELTATLAPLLGLLGTVLGMIEAFRTLEEAGGSPDASLLAGGIWQALSTTAAGMIVAIVATAFLALFDSGVERLEELAKL